MDILSPPPENLPDYTFSPLEKQHYHPFHLYRNLSIFILFLLVSLFITLDVGYLTLVSKAQHKNGSQKDPRVPPQAVCTQDAKQCPDGSYVSRNGPNCTFSPCPTSTVDSISNWKTYQNKEGLFKISYPPNWSQGTSGGTITLGENKIDISIIVWNDGSTKYVETQWKRIDCAPGNDPNSGCAPLYNKEEKKLSLHGYTVYFRVDGYNQMHAYIPNPSKNKTVEIQGPDSLLTTFDQILSTFKFLE